MPLFLTVGLMLAQAATNPQPVTTRSEAPAKKPARICQYMELSGSRMRQKVCLDRTGELELPMGVARGAPNSAMLKAAPSGTGEAAGQGFVPQ